MKHLDMNIKIFSCERKDHTILEKINGVLFQTSVILILTIIMMDIIIWPLLVKAVFR